MKLPQLEVTEIPHCYIKESHLEVYEIAIGNPE